MVCLSLQVYIFTKFRVFFQILSIQLHRGDDLTMLLIIVLQIFYAFGAMFIACELGQRVNLAFNECSEMIHRFDWYLLPAEIQRLLPLIINFAQQPIDIKCFGSAACDRETTEYVSVSSNQLS